MAKKDEKKQPGKKKGSAIPAEEKAIGDKLAALRKVEKPSDEQKEQIKALAANLKTLRFGRIANKRIPRVLKAIRGIGSLAGASYARTPEQAEKVVAALEGAVREVKARFSGEVTQAEAFSV